MKRTSTLTAMTIALAACSPSKTTHTTEVTTNETRAAAPIVAEPPAGNDTVPAAPSSATAPNILALEGLGPLKVGEALPSGSGWGERGAQASDACRTVRSAAYPGVYAIVEGGKVRRITVAKGSTVTLVEGIGVGASEADVRKWFAGFRAEPHKYEAAPAKYLTAPNAQSGDPALRFEIGQDGKVRAIHVGTMPALGYVEGCS